MSSDSWWSPFLWAFSPLILSVLAASIIAGCLDWSNAEIASSICPNFIGQEYEKAIDGSIPRISASDSIIVFMIFSFKNGKILYHLVVIYELWVIVTGYEQIF